MKHPRALIFHIHILYCFQNVPKNWKRLVLTLLVKKQRRVFFFAGNKEEFDRATDRKLKQRGGSNGSSATGWCEIIRGQIDKLRGIKTELTSHKCSLCINRCAEARQKSAESLLGQTKLTTGTRTKTHEYQRTPKWIHHTRQNRCH